MSDIDTLYLVCSDDDQAERVDVCTSYEEAENRVRELYDSRADGDETDWYVTGSDEASRGLLELAIVSVLDEIRRAADRPPIFAGMADVHRVVELAQMLDHLSERHALERERERVSAQ